MSSLFKTSLDGANFRNFQTIDQVNYWGNIFFSLDLLVFFRPTFSSYPLTKSLYLLLHQVLLFTNLHANVDLIMWVELTRDWVIGSNNMFILSLEIKLSHHVNNQNDNADLVISSNVIQQLGNTSCVISRAPKPIQTVILEFFTNGVLPFNWKWWNPFTWNLIIRICAGKRNLFFS